MLKRIQSPNAKPTIPQLTALSGQALKGIVGAGQRVEVEDHGSLK